MIKAIYKNYKTGKHYTFDKIEETGENKIYTVFDDAHVYDAAPIRQDKNGKVYKALPVEKKTLKNGFDVFVTIHEQ